MESDEPLELLLHALAALKDFYKEEEDNKKKFEQLRERLEADFDKRSVSMDLFQENWHLSQFWYDDETSRILGLALLEGADSDTVVCIASAPSVYAAICRMDKVPTEHIYLLEYDKRFEVMAKDHFYVYDYNKPRDVPAALAGKCHRLLIDPPFLEEECQTLSAEAARNLLAPDQGEKTRSGDVRFKLISSTGERMRDIMRKTYPETRETTFHPRHQNGLSNEFRCYASFECSHWRFGGP